MTDHRTYEDLVYQLDEGVVTITIDRPDVKNSFRKETLLELNDAIRAATEDDHVYVIILTGADDSFCAGADVTQMPDWSDQSREEYAGFLWIVQNVVRQLRSSPKPTVAAVDGPAIGAGCDFALACDIRYLSPDAILKEGFVTIGLIPGDGGAWLLPRLIGEAKAKEYLLTGRNITAETATDLGLATGIEDDPLGASREFANEILSLPALGVRYTKRLMAPSLDFEEYCRLAIEYQWECVNDAEHEEAIAAFREDREPSYDRDLE